MARNVVTFAAAALLAGTSLTACGSEEEAEVQNNAAAERPAPAAANLPPAIQASRTYRCADNTLVYVDFFTDQTASIRLEELGTPTRLAPRNGQPPFEAEGYSVAANAPSTSITLPGKPAQTCRARG
jgi:crotonobetainyl-CoA:carnitine CoA-transferase CaiB-like acyl-CoA transferase